MPEMEMAAVKVGDKVKVKDKDMVGIVKQRIGENLERCVIQMGAPGSWGSPIIIEDVANVEVLVSGAAPKAGAAEETKATSLDHVSSGTAPFGTITKEKSDSKGPIASKIAENVSKEASDSDSDV